MAILQAESPLDLVQGGRAGDRGEAGIPGRGGDGGEGGDSKRWTDSDNKSHYKSGGWSGPKGADGRPSYTANTLKDGSKGLDGRFRIHVIDRHDGPFLSRYDFHLGSKQIHSVNRLDTCSLTFHFGDTVQVSDIVVYNKGGMISPIQHSKLFLLKSPFVDPIHDSVAFVESRIKPKDS